MILSQRFREKEEVNCSAGSCENVATQTVLEAISKKEIWELFLCVCVCVSFNRENKHLLEFVSIFVKPTDIAY